MRDLQKLSSGSNDMQSLVPSDWRAAGDNGRLTSAKVDISEISTVCISGSTWANTVTGDLAAIDLRRSRATWNSAFRPRPVRTNTAPYFSFTKSKTKIAQTPTVTGNCAACASRRNEPPFGIAKVSKNIATAVSIPRTNLLFQFIFVLPRF